MNLARKKLVIFWELMNVEQGISLNIAEKVIGMVAAQTAKRNMTDRKIFLTRGKTVWITVKPTND